MFWGGVVGNMQCHSKSSGFAMGHFTVSRNLELTTIGGIHPPVVDVKRQDLYQALLGIFTMATLRTRVTLTPTCIKKWHLVPMLPRIPTKSLLNVQSFLHANGLFNSDA